MPSRTPWSERFSRVRAETERLAAPLSAEDQQLQAMPEASPSKWHRAHTTWFFETFVLTPRGIPPVNAAYEFLFNSYYEAVGPRHPRPKRGLISRPSAAEVTNYRRAVDGRMIELLSTLPEEELSALAPLLHLGLAHEEQHQELLLTDILAAFAQNPTRPVYQPEPFWSASPSGAQRWLSFGDGITEIGAQAVPFCFDNELPRHRVFVEPFALSSRPVTVGEVLAFIDAKGYQTPSLWLSEGWDWVQQHGISAPGYAEPSGGALWAMTLHGWRRASPEEPASHLSYYEADALARFLGGRLPTEFEWEKAAAGKPVAGQFREEGAFVPRAGHDTPGFFGGVWEWTSSSYSAYPGFAPGAGALGEYNGKFMIGQQVLRGGSCFSNQDHLRATYRNFWHPQTRFQMTGARVARDLGRT
jgi:ergothioneine biosynthesis protein EgtB